MFTILLGPVSPHNKKFPYLKAENLTKKRRERLLAQLEVESGKTQDKFAILVDRARESLENQRIACNDLKVLVSHSQKNRLINLLEQSKTIAGLFFELRKYWSFFDYEFLSVIINRHCPELKSELNEFVSSFKEFIKRRVCEVPADVFKKREDDEYNLYVKYSHDFDKITMEDVKQLEYKLSDLLGTDLYLLEVEEGCIRLVFYSSCAITTSLNTEQIEDLKELGVSRLYSDSVIYFDSTDISTVSEVKPRQLSIPEQVSFETSISSEYEAKSNEESTNLKDLLADINMLK